MTRSVISDGFDHHLWATLRVLDVCADLDEAQLATVVPGTFGSIIDTLRHLVGADAAYLVPLTGGQFAAVDETGMDVLALRRQIELNAPAWAEVVAGDIDPDVIVTRHREDGSAGHAPRGVRLMQALHHGTDHRSQICTALTSLGREPPEIDVWDFADAQGRLSESPPS